MKTKTPRSLPTLITEGTTSEIQNRYPKASLHHFINPFGIFSVCITDDLLAIITYIYISLNIVFQWLAFCFIYLGGGFSLQIWL